MKTAKERAIEIVQQMRTNMNIPKHLQDGLVGRITLALKDQDKITRHACAEIVMKSPGIEPNGYVDPVECYQAIMNANYIK